MVDFSKKISVDSLQFVADGWIYALNFDWQTRNLYVGTENGFIVACDTRPISSSSLTCAVVFKFQDSVWGIAVHPMEGQDLHSSKIYFIYNRTLAMRRKF